MKNLPDLGARVIDYDDQRFPTVGDYFEVTWGWQFKISDLGNSDYEFLVFIHELVEWYLTQKRGITEPEILAFDTAYEAARTDIENMRKVEDGYLFPWELAAKHHLNIDTIHRLLDDLTSEPGHDKRAPYHREHVFAECIERLVAQELGVSWSEYEAAVNALP